MGVMTIFRSAFGVFETRHPVDLREQFEREYPLSLAGRLEFHEERLGLSRGEILALAGAPPAFAADPAIETLGWDMLVAQQAPEHRERLAAVESLIADVLARFDYDGDAAGIFLRVNELHD
jgi:hypothetical protein